MSYFITTLGCVKNQADSRQMALSLQKRGLVLAADATTADVHVINSCAFIESARRETIAAILEAYDARQQTDQKLVVAGCFSQRYANEIKTELPEVDLAFGTGQYAAAGSLIVDRFEWQERLQEQEAGQRPALQSSPGSDLARLTRAGVSSRQSSSALETVWAPIKISDGCNRGCSFCAIPAMRGPFQSLAVDAILDEARLLIAQGVREICLVSQDTNHFGGQTEALVDLICRLDEIPGLEWQRLLYMYPDPLSLAVYRQLAPLKLRSFVPYLESPVQHVAPRVLRAMKRYGSMEFFTDFFGEIRSLYDQLEIRTALLCGFPTEGPAEVDAALQFIETVRPEKLALFSYSAEEGTAAWGLADPVPADEKACRVNLLRAAHLQVLQELHLQRLGRRYNCMIDKIDSDSTLTARRPQDAPDIDEQVFVELDPAARRHHWQPGQIVPLEINGFFEYDMSGRLVLESK
ncbi:MAG: MiaB/RimO family radical SAM methylthiotransferase [Leptospiraceae bacterium]|nr:MiaB/RimO family radical SAM methylthiotransferase [Leptospiraceae bacterium]